MTVTLVNSPEHVAHVDDADYALVSMHVWFLVQKRNKLYATAKINGRRRYLHRFLMGEPRGKIVDHEDGDGLNCRRSSNLRCCTRSQNMGNSKKHRDRKGKFKGVHYDEKEGRYVARICCQRKRYTLGRFKSATEAALAYDKKALELFGDFALTNFTSVLRALRQCPPLK